METLTYKPYGERQASTKHQNNRVEFQGGNEQVQRRTVNPLKQWELKYSGTYQDMLDIQGFHDRCYGGAVKFLWTDGKGTQHIVRFANDEIKVTEKYGYGDDGLYGIQGFETSITLRKVWIA